MCLVPQTFLCYVRPTNQAKDLGDVLAVTAAVVATPSTACSLMATTRTFLVVAAAQETTAAPPAATVDTRGIVGAFWVPVVRATV